MNQLSSITGETAAVLVAEHAARVSAAYSNFDDSYHDVQTVICAIRFIARGSDDADDAGAEHNRDALMHIFGLTGIAERLCEGNLFANGKALAKLAEVQS